MFVEECRRAVMVAPLTGLDALSKGVWQAYGAGALDDEETGVLCELIAARRACSEQLARAPRRVGSRPRTSASLERRRAWTASGWLPPTVAARFTMGEAAALAVIIAEAAKAGRCGLPIGAIAGRRGSVPPPSATLCGKPDGSGWCGSRNGGCPTPEVCRTSSRSPGASWRCGCEPAPGSSARGVGTKPWSRPPTIYLLILHGLRQRPATEEIGGEAMVEVDAGAAPAINPTSTILAHGAVVGRQDLRGGQAGEVASVLASPTPTSHQDRVR